MTRTTVGADALHAFVDGELDALAMREMEDRAAADPALAVRIDGLRRTRAAVAEAADYHAASGALRARVAAIGRHGPDRVSTDVRDVPRRAAWSGWRPLGASLALVMVSVLATGLGLDAWRDRSEGASGRLARDVVASHVRATLGEHLVDVASSDHHAVKPWLSARLDFSPPVPTVALPGTPFIGGRVDYLDGHPVAALVFRHGNHVVDSFVWPVDAPDAPPTITTDRGFHIARWTKGRMSHWTISDVNAAEFDAIVTKLAIAD